MKKINILVGIVFFMLVISGTAALKTNAIVQCEDTPGSVIETSEPPCLLIETPIDTTMQVIMPDNITEITVVVPAPLTPRFINCTVNFTFPRTATVYTDREEYRRGETVIYGVENTGNINIGAGCLAIQRSLNGGWENVVGPICTLLLLSPGDKWELTWDIDEQVELGSYRVEGGCGSVAYFSITNIYSVVPPSGDFPVNVTVVNNTDLIPIIIPPGDFPVNVTIMNDTGPNVYTDKEEYRRGETVTYGIENTLNYNIGGVSVSIEKMVTCNWEPVLLTYYMPLFLPPGGVYESTWDQKGGYGRQVETGWYRVAIGYGYQGGHDTGYAYFSIINTYPHPANVVLDSFEDVFVRDGGYGCVRVTFQLKNTGDEVATDVSCFIKCCDQNGMILFAQMFTFDDLSPNNMVSGEYDVPMTNKTMWVTHGIEVHWSQGTKFEFITWW